MKKVYYFFEECDYDVDCGEKDCYGGSIMEYVPCWELREFDTLEEAVSELVDRTKNGKECSPISEGFKVVKCES